MRPICIVIYKKIDVLMQVESHDEIFSIMYASCIRIFFRYDRCGIPVKNLKCRWLFQ